MSLNKQQLEAVNQANFPDNNTSFITPQLLREFNTDMIDAIQLTGSYATTGSNTFVGNQTITGNLNVSGVISASILHVQIETASVIYSSGSNQFGDELTDTQTLSGSVKVQGSLTVNGVPVLTGSVSVDTGSLVTTASFNQYTQSTNIRLNNLELNSASVNVSIGNLNQTTASLNTSITNLNQFTSSQKTLNGTFATTGSNTFTGNQIIDRSSKLFTNGIYWTDVTAGFNNLEIINQGGGNLDFASLNGGKMRIVNTPLILTGSALSSSNDISTSANIYGANLVTSTDLTNLSASLTVTDNFLQSQIDALDPSGSAASVASLNAFTASQLIINAGYNTFTQSTNTSISALNTATQSLFLSASLAIVTASINNDDITFTKGDGSQFTIQVATGSFALSASFAETSSITRNVVIIARNGNASTLPAGTVVHITSAVGDNPIFTTASYDNEALSSNTFGLLRNSSLSGADVEVVVNGVVTGVNTDPALGYTAGDIVYLSSSGQFTKVQPQAPNQIVTLGQVLRAQQNNGSIYVSINNGWELNELHNVQINNAQTGDLLQYESSSYGLWKNRSISGAGITSTSSFNSYTSSTNSRLTNIENTTASLLVETSNLEIFSASALVSISNLNASSASQQVSINALNAATGSYVTETESGSFLITASFDNGTRNLTFTKGNNTTFAVNIPDVSGSAGNFVTTSSFNAYTSSTNTRLTNIESTTASLLVETQNLELFSASALSSISQLNASSASQQVSINNLNTTTASLLIETQNLELFSASALVSINSLNGRTGSFATTGSNAFFGTNTFSGAVSFTGSAPSILSSSFSGSLITNLTDIYTDIPAVRQIVTLTSASYAALLSGSLTNPNTLYIVSGSISGSGGGGTPTDITALNQFTASQYVSNSFFATTGSNTFTGNQTIQDNALNVLGQYPGFLMAANTNGSGSQYPFGTIILDSATYSGDGVIGAWTVQDSPTSQGIGLGINTYSSVYGFPNPVPMIYGQGNITGGDDTLIGFPAGRVDIWRPTNISGNLNITGSLTASLQQGYTWVGGAGNITTLVATSSFGGGGTINTGSFATTGSNTFVGNQIISGTFLQSGSNSLSGGPGGQTAGTHIQNRVLISGPSSGDTPRLWISGSDGAVTEIGRSFINIDSTKTGLGSSTFLGANVANSAINTVAVYNDDFSVDSEIQMFANSSSVGFADWDNGSTFNYVPFMTLAPNTGNNPAPQFKRSISVTGSVDITGQFTINGVPVSGSGGSINTGSFATTGSNTFVGAQSITGTPDATLDMYSNAGNFDTFNILTSASNGVYLRDFDQSNLSNWLYIPTNTGNNPSPIFTRGLVVTGSLSVSSNATIVGDTSISGTTNFNNVTRYRRSTPSDSYGEISFVNNQSLSIATKSTLLGGQTGSFQIMTMTTGSGGNAAFQMTAEISGTVGQLKVQNTAGTSSVAGLADNILFAKAEGFPNTPATSFKVEATNLSLVGDVKVNKGSNKTSDIVTVGSGGLTVSSSLVTTDSIILVTTQNNNVAPAIYPAVVGNKTNGSFSLSHNYGGNLQVAYLIINPA